MNACHKGKNHIAKFQDNPMLKEKNKNKNKKWQSKASWFNSTSMSNSPPRSWGRANIIESKLKIIMMANPEQFKCKKLK